MNRRNATIRGITAVQPFWRPDLEKCYVIPVNTPTVPPQTTPAGASSPGWVEQVTQIFGTTATLVTVASDSSSIPAPLRHVSDWRLLGRRQPAPQILAVHCGTASQNLAAAIFGGPKAAGAFINANPSMQSSLLTWWPNSFLVLWMRLDWLPANTSDASMCWVSNGIIPIALQGQPARHFVYRDGPVAKLPFATLKWPATLQDAFRVQLLTEAYGPRYRQVGPRKVVLNLGFWAALLASKLGFVYRLREKAFYRSQPADGQGEQVPKEVVLNDTMCVLQQEASLAPLDFPAGEIRLSVVKALVEHMKIVVAVHSPGERDGLAQFVRERVEQRPGSDVTTAELYTDYVDYCMARKLPRYTESKFQRLLPPVVKQMFTVIRSHDILRPGPEGETHWHRGYRALGLKRSDGTVSSDAPGTTSACPEKGHSSSESVPSVI